ncbi:hypothetical protein ARTHROSP310_05540 [Arthrobacter sp. AD-310]
MSPGGRPGVGRGFGCVDTAGLDHEFSVCGHHSLQAIGTHLAHIGLEQLLRTDGQPGTCSGPPGNVPGGFLSDGWRRFHSQLRDNGSEGGDLLQQLVTGTGHHDLPAFEPDPHKAGNAAQPGSSGRCPCAKLPCRSELLRGQAEVALHGLSQRNLGKVRAGVEGIASGGTGRRVRCRVRSPPRRGRGKGGGRH